MKGIIITLLASLILSPQASSLFEKHTDPQSGVVSYILKPGQFSFNQQSDYFVNKTMTDDGRFLLFLASENEFNGEKTERRYCVIDFEKDIIIPLNIPMKGGHAFLDPETDILYYYSVGQDIIFCRELMSDPLKDIVLCHIPQALHAEGTVKRLCTHMTLSSDKNHMFVDARVDDKFIQGLLNIRTGEWEEWGRTDFNLNHGQINPVRSDIALAAHEISWTDAAGTTHNIENIDGVYPRLRILKKGEISIVPPMDGYATHEKWDEDGSGFYWCGAHGVFHCDLESGTQEKAAPFGDHATMSKDKRYVVSDKRIGKFYRGSPWRVYFWDRKKEKGVFINSYMPGITTPDKPSVLHPDPHPQFVCGDKYIIYTLMGEDHRMNLAITPVKGLKKALKKVQPGAASEKYDKK